ncbi:oligopeptide/dipeptide ABC transporter ATP-binding protein [Castellaniella sp. MT123]|uniref:oligopeptide/dipeptide ABC transporter ATP-binding protein n=1 Tax=Castellaniella sp. MT123 TaxID=3140381 RepID=UPI0031F3A66B
MLEVRNLSVHFGDESALLSATPRLNPTGHGERIRISGALPSPLNPPPGCPFSSRCPRVMPVCRETMPELKMQAGRLVACHAVEQDLGTP